MSSSPVDQGSASQTGPDPYDTVDPIGRPLQLTVDPVAGEGFGRDQHDEIRASYRAHGYVVVRGVIPVDLARRANDEFDREIRDDTRPFYRLSGRPEAHTFTDTGFMFDGMRDVQSLDRRRSPGFVRASLDVLTHPALADAVEVILGERGTIVQTMYFEGNPSTQPHQDTYYLDADPLGTMVAAWIATEDIAPGAGRFFVCPDSQAVSLPLNSGSSNIVEHYDEYLDAVGHAMHDLPLEVHAPALRAGDVLFWSSMTIHGSLGTSQPERSRRSFTAHFIPDRAPFLQWQTRRVPLKLQTVNGVRVHHPKDLNRFPTRMRYQIETRFPNQAARLKRLIAKRVVES